MNSLEKFALNCGLKINAPEMVDEYTPNVFDKYILIDSSSENSNDIYSHYEEVVYILRKCLKGTDIKILNNYGSPEEEVKNSEISFSLSGRQLNYMAKNSLLVITNDNLSLQISGNLNKKIVALFGSRYAQNGKAFFGDESNQINLEPNTELKPFFDSVEESESKRIDCIHPENVAKAACELLNIDFIHSYQTINIGRNYKNKSGGVECVPDQVVQPPENNPEGLIYRMDLLFKEENLARQLSVGKCVPMTNKRINMDLLATFKENIPYLIYKIEKDDDPSFVQEVAAMGIKVALITKLTEEEINSKKLDYIDVGLIKVFSKDQDFINKYNKEEVYYKSTRGLLSNGKIFASENAWINGRSIKHRLEPTLCDNIEDISYDLDAYNVSKKVD